MFGQNEFTIPNFTELNSKWFKAIENTIFFTMKKALVQLRYEHASTRIVYGIARSGNALQNVTTQ